MSHIVIVIDTEDVLHKHVTEGALMRQFAAGRELHYEADGIGDGTPVILRIDASRVTVQDEADKVTLYQDGGGEFRWRRQAGNAKIITSGEGYTRRSDVERGALRANLDLSSESFHQDGEEAADHGG